MKRNKIFITALLSAITLSACGDDFSPRKKEFIQTCLQQGLNSFNRMVNNYPLSQILREIPDKDDCECLADRMEIFTNKGMSTDSAFDSAVRQCQKGR